MTNEELEKAAAVRNVDGINFVTDDLHRTIDNLGSFFHYHDWNLRRTAEGSGMIETAELQTKNGIVLRVVRPLYGNTVYQEYLDRFGSGIMGPREKISAESWDEEIGRYADRGVRILPVEDGRVMLDLRITMGAVFELHRDEPACEETLPVADRKICQICIVTDDVKRTARELWQKLELGPWEIGTCNNRTMAEMSTTAFPAGTMPESEFLAGIGMYGNLQFEIIQPVKGPLSYFTYLNRHGCGFQHIKEELTPDTYDEKVIEYSPLGVLLSGRIGPCWCCNLDTEDLIGFVYELSDGREMDKLPEGYDPHMYC